jgi:hypothetical protein
VYEALNQYLASRNLKLDETKAATRRSIAEYLQKAREDNKAYLALASPTAAERNTQIIKLTRQNNRILRLLLNDLTGEE